MGQYVLNEKDGRYLFNLCSSNGHILGTSLVFPSREECLAGIDAVREDAPTAAVEDSTVDVFKREPAPKYRIYETLSLGQLLLPLLHEGQRRHLPVAQLHEKEEPPSAHRAHAQ